MLENAKLDLFLEVVKFAYDRYGSDDQWRNRMQYKTFWRVAEDYFQEFVNWEDWRKNG